jgi:hypothetical protein
MMGIRRTEPSADIRKMAAMWWQLFVALRQEGFTESQAMTALGHMIQGSMASTSPDDGQDEDKSQPT